MDSNTIDEVLDLSKNESKTKDTIDRNPVKNLKHKPFSTRACEMTSSAIAKKSCEKPISTEHSSLPHSSSKKDSNSFSFVCDSSSCSSSTHSSKTRASQKIETDESSVVTLTGERNHLLTTTVRTKDANYYEKRRRNNLAARKSRDAKRKRDAELQARVAVLEQENKKLRYYLSMCCCTFKTCAYKRLDF